MPKKRVLASFFHRFFVPYCWVLYPVLLLLILILVVFREQGEKLLFAGIFVVAVIALLLVFLLTKRRRAAAALVVLLILSSGAGVLDTWYWSQYHQFVSEVQSITAYRHAGNPDYVRFEIRGRIRNWYYDDEVYEDVVLTGYEPGGEIRYTRFASRSEPITISRRATSFTIRLDVDATSYVWGPSVEEYPFVLRYLTGREEWRKNAVFMNDFRRVPVRWEEPREVTDCLLDGLPEA